MLIACSFAALLASLAGGTFPSLFRFTHTRLQTAISVIAGLMLGMALLHLIPHAAAELHSFDRATSWALGGFLTLFFLQRIFHYHQHEAPAEVHPSSSCTVSHGTPAMTASATDRLCGGVSSLSWIGAGLGLGFHSLLDGLALAAAVAAETRNPTGLVALGTGLAVVLHKPFDSLAVITLMRSAGCTVLQQRLANVALALITPAGVALAFLGLGDVAEANHHLLGVALAFCGGSFLCIACSDLLPELHFHSHDRFRLSLALLAGLGIAILIGRFEHAGHEHGPEAAAESSSPPHDHRHAH